MKFNKLTKVFLTASMVLPLAVAPVAANASQNGSNAKTEKVTKNNKTQSFALGEAGNKFKKAKAYHTKDNKPVVYKAMFMADQPVVELTATKQLPSLRKTLYVDQQINVKTGNKLSTILKSKKAYKAAKNVSYSHVKGYGWVKTSELTKGIFMSAD
ncbi:hypothetical protein FD06_GL001380 [Apilactobacillus ozensis DSM 23829 = JCM 17196]|uniref:Surface layer protein A domain-containing protein n=1 Tax=Apilactobacillus ozensis DSM 23829 = JCM 17196 TaxID=1423781 RepID=A0A0R2AX21_9LACO|nr:hypothetical protein [Apilactobacillus ozensis]KRM68166.1 hypothetical protein FD06_GL001380 [Apilactobacillus ozensis DSM 23829 = JCM 17196]